MSVLQTIVATLVSTGIIAKIIHHFYAKRLKSHELKIERYMSLIDELANLLANQPDWGKLVPLLNGALCYASDDVVSEILRFNAAFTKARESADRSPTFQMAADQLKPLIRAIRKDLYLKSKSLDKCELRFFQKDQCK